MVWRANIEKQKEFWVPREQRHKIYMAPFSSLARPIHNSVLGKDSYIKIKNYSSSLPTLGLALVCED